MRRFKNILYIVEGDKENQWHATDKVQDLARLNDARVSIVRIEEQYAAGGISNIFADKNEELSRYVLDQHQRLLDTMVSDDGWREIDLYTEVLQGRGFIKVIQKVLKDGHDLVIIEDHSSHGLDQLSMRLIRKCPCPVWVIKKNASQPFRRILGTVDLENTRPENLALNKKIVELCHSLAQREQGEAHYLHAWQLEFEAMLTSPRFNVSDDEIEQMKNELYQERNNNFSSLLNDCLIQPAEGHIHLLEGEPVGVIENMLQALAIDVIVMGTVGRTGISGLLIGNKAEKLLNSINCTVLAVKPDGFISPVTLAG